MAKINVPSLVAYDIKWSGKEDLFFVTTLGSQLLAYDSKTFQPVSSACVTPDQPHSKCETVATNFKQYNNRILCGSSRGVIAWY